MRIIDEERVDEDSFSAIFPEDRHRRGSIFSEIDDFIYDEDSSGDNLDSDYSELSQLVNGEEAELLTADKINSVLGMIIYKNIQESKYMPLKLKIVETCLQQFVQSMCSFIHESVLSEEAEKSQKIKSLRELVRSFPLVERLQKRVVDRLDRAKTNDIIIAKLVFDVIIYY